MPPALIALGAVAVGAGTTAAVTGVIIAGYTIGATMAAVIGATVAMSITMVGNTLFGPSVDIPSFLPSIENQSRGILLNKASNNAPIPVIYGSRRVGGTRVFIETTGETNQYLHIVLVLCEGVISAINTVYLDGVPTTDSRFSGHIRINKHLGASDQVADSDLVSEITAWTSDHRLQGVAYIYARLKYNPDVYRRMPEITADVDGRTLFDPRNDLTAFSNNPALCFRDYFTNTLYGRGIDESLMDDDATEAEANYCEENVTVAGETQQRYTCDGLVDTSFSSMVNVTRLLSSCRGMAVFSGGKYKLVIDRPRVATSFEFNEDNIVGSWTISLGNKRNTFNRIRAGFFNPERDWQPDIAPADNATYRTQDNGLLLERQIELPFTANYGTAMQIATINLQQSRQQIACKFTATVAGMIAEVGNVVPITHSTPGWTAKNFLILNIGLKNNDEVEITAREYDLSVYDFEIIEAARATPNTNLPDPFTVGQPTNLIISESLYITRDGAGVKAKATLTWTAANDYFVNRYQVEYKLAADSDYIVAGRTDVVTFDILDIAAGFYDFRVKSINDMRISSEFVTLQIEIYGLTATPADIVDFSLQIINNQAHLSWSQCSELDVKMGGKIRIRHSSLTSGAAWQNAFDIGPAIPGVGTSTILPSISGTYLIKAVDSTGHESDNAVSIVTTVPDIVNMNAVATSTQNPDFSGSKTNMVAPDSILKFDGAVLFDARSGNVDDWEDWDSEGSLETSGSYEFDNYIDLGSVQTARITMSLDFTADEITDFIDSRGGNVDAWDSWDSLGFSDVQADLYIATTADDPAGAPSWSDWTRFVVGDYTARAFKFKLFAASGINTHQILITGLAATVDMPDKVQGVQGISIDAGGDTVTYAMAFYATPALGVTAIDLATGDYVEITNEDETGFDIQVKNSAGAGVARTINYLARGY